MAEKILARQTSIEILDSLSSLSTTAALSAKKGKELNDSLNAIQPNTLSHAVTESIAVSDWSPVPGSDAYQADVTGLTGMTGSSKVIVAPAPASIDTYVKCGVYAYSHESTAMTVRAKKLPDTAVSLNIAYTEG